MTRSITTWSDIRPNVGLGEEYADECNGGGFASKWAIKQTFSFYRATWCFYITPKRITAVLRWLSMGNDTSWLYPVVFLKYRAHEAHLDRSGNTSSRTCHMLSWSFLRIVTCHFLQELSHTRSCNKSIRHSIPCIRCD